VNRSQIYKGFVEHERFFPTRHRLRYKIYVYAIDLDDLPRLDRRLPLFGYNRLRPVSLFDRDYLADEPGSLREKLLRQAATRMESRRVARIVVVTSPRYFNYVFNPVSFYYCFDASENLVGAVAEVNNTFGERHIYVLPAEQQPPPAFPARFESAKQFHVSPFNTMDGSYHFHLADIRHELDVRIALHREGRKVMHARLRGTAVPLTPWQHLRTVVTHPAVPHLTVPRIYWEAFRLRFRRRLAYHGKPVPLSPMTIRRVTATPFQRRCRAFVEDALGATRYGRLSVNFPDGKHRTYTGPQEGPHAVLEVKDARFFSRVVLAGGIGFGEAFMHSEWDSLDPVKVIRFFIRNREAFADGDYRSSWPARALARAVEFGRRNTIGGSRRNIRRHYDLSNNFFRLFLDRSLAYSSAIYHSPDEDLESAQQHKYEAIICKARLQANDHLLEIGCGWGGFAIAAARQTGCRVTGITVSHEQYDLARSRVKAAGLADLVQIVLTDYRQVSGRFDKIVSIEMLEAVGVAYYPIFFRRLDKLLHPQGIAVLQTITIPDQHFQRYRRESDWIRKHIFPGGQLPSLTVLTEQMTRHSSLMVDHLENIGHHYALTLEAWRRRFDAHREAVAALGFDRVFRRKWRYYLASCEAAFRERVIGDLQLVLTRAGNRRMGKATATVADGQSSA
jgi:cyclopropane-fatty-acyl-phospholipid synthase